MDIALKYPALRAQAHKAAMCAGCTGVERAGQLAVAAVEKALHAADSPDDWAMEGGLWLVGNDGSVEQRWFATSSDGLGRLTWKATKEDTVTLGEIDLKTVLSIAADEREPKASEPLAMRPHVMFGTCL